MNYWFEATEDEMLLILRALDLKTECTLEETAKKYKALFDRLERVFEGREE